MNNLPVFVFGTPEGGTSSVLEFLEGDQYKIINNPEVEIHGFYDFVNKMKQADKDLVFPQGILQSSLPLVKGADSKSVIADNHVGKDYGWGFRVWFSLACAFPEIKMIFVYTDMETSLVRVMGRKQRWIPTYGSCAGNCERRTREQILQMQQFSQYWGDNAITFDFKKDDYGKIREFLA